MTQAEAAPETLDCPRILFGPLYNTLQPGRYLYHPHFRSFVYGPSAQTGNQAAAHMRAERPAGVHIQDLCPADFEPELLIWSSLALLGLPLGIEDCPYPTLAIAHDWHLNAQACLENAWRFDFVVGDRACVRLLRSQGYTRCAEILNYSFQPGNHMLWPGLERCWDISFVGDISYTHHPQRNQDLQRILKLAQKHRVFIGQHYYGQDYTRILNQSKIVVNRSVRGELNMRSFEAAACGALVFIERENLEVDQLFRPGESCVLYDEQDLEAQLSYYLEHPEARQALAHKGMQAVHRLHTPEQHFQALLALVPQVQAAYAQRKRIAMPLALARQLFFSHSAGAQQQALDIAHARAQVQGAGEAILAAQFELAMGINLCLNQPRSASDRARLLQQAQALLQRQASRLTSYYWGYAAMLNGRMAEALQCWHGLYQSLQRQWLSEDEIQRFFVVPGGCGPNLSAFRQTWERDLAAFWQGQLELEDLTRRLQAQLLEGLGQLWSQQALQQANLELAQQAIRALQGSLQVYPFHYANWQSLLLLRRLSIQQGADPQLYLQDLKQAITHLGLLEPLQREHLQALQILQPTTLPEAVQDYRALIHQLLGHARNSRLFGLLAVVLEDWAQSLASQIDFAQEKSPLNAGGQD